MEANPGTLTPDSAAGYRNAGVSRLSLGLQSASEEELRLLGRIHTREQFLQSFRAARDAGFDNINVDLMSALPGQSEESWQETLRFVCDLEPEHISAYSLIVEEGTPLYEEYGEMCADLEKYGDYASMPKRLQTKYEGCKCLPDEETDRNMYHHTKTRWRSWAMSGMRFPIMPDRAMPAATTSVTGPVWSIWGLVWGHPRWWAGNAFR